MNRTYDLKKTMSYLIETANDSPPVEIAILDYNSKDDLEEFIKSVKEAKLLRGRNRLVYKKYTGRNYYHLAHAYNLAVLSSIGKYIVVAGTDAIFRRDYIREIRNMIKEGCIWMRGKYFKGIVACQRKEFIDSGGYDERFEFYGGEDRDMEARLKRQGGKFGLVSDGLIKVIITPKSEKFKNYRPNYSRSKAKELKQRILEEGEKNNILVANEGKLWGQNE